MADRRELPEGWEFINLGQLEKTGEITFQNGFACGVNNQEGRGIPQLRPMNVSQSGQISLDSLKFIETERDVSNYILQPNDVIFNNTNSAELVGKTAVWNGELENSVLSNHMTIIRVIKKTCLDPNFLSRYLHNLWSKNYFENICQEHINQASVSLERLREVEIPHPPHPVQRQIVAVLEQAEAVKNHRQEADALTGALLQSVFYEMFGDPLKNEKGWELKNLIQIVSNKPNSIKRGPFGSSIKKEFFVKNGYKIYEQSNVLQNDFERGNYFIDEKKFRELEDFEISPNDLLITCSGTGTVGKIAIVPKGIQRGVINQALLKITLDPDKVELYFFKQLFYLKFHDPFSRNVLGSAIPNITSVSELKKILFPIPPIELQQQFARVVESVERIRDHQVESGKEIEGLCEGLMARAFAGELVA
jgi:type I restriction enzyme S subunit